MADPIPKDPDAFPEPEPPKEPEIKEPEATPEPPVPPVVPSPPPVDVEPPVRKSAKDWIIERKNKKIESLTPKPGEEPAPVPGEEEVTPEGKRAIQREVQQATAPLLQRERDQADEAELAQVFAEYPEAKSLETEIRKYMANEAYQATPIKFIYLGIAAGRGNVKIVSQEEQKTAAQAEAARSGLGGRGNRPADLPAIPDVSKMTDAQLDELSHKVKTGQA